MLRWVTHLLGGQAGGLDADTDTDLCSGLQIPSSVNGFEQSMKMYLCVIDLSGEEECEGW